MLMTSLHDAAAPDHRTRHHVRSGSRYEDVSGFSRALRTGRLVDVSGTDPVWPDGSCDPDPAVQATRCLDIIELALRETGGSLADVVRTRMYVTDAGMAEAVGRVHGARFATVRPAATMVVVAGLVDPRWVVEIEAEALLPAGGQPGPDDASSGSEDGAPRGG
jgi:enamine deaminase RidA (YjgF/YER057c/UK114 family)